jgi:DNA-binding transcriptional regulator LsrR (DeoR family)/transcriptional regulator with XRE-family HTH domain
MTDFAHALQSVMDERQLTKGDLAACVKVDRATVDRWLDKTLPRYESLVDLCRALDVSADYLLNLNPPPHPHIDNYTRNSLEWQWFEQIPADTPEEQVAEIGQGIKVFKGMLMSESETRTVIVNRDLREENRLLRVAGASGALRLLKVPRDAAREEEIQKRIQKRFPASVPSEILVAALPQSESGKWFWQSDLLRTEFVSFLVATEVLNKFPRTPKALGIGPGFTVLRCMELTTPSTTKFTGTKFVPLVTLKSPEDDPIAMSPNHTSAMMAIHHPGSEIIRLPYLSPEQRSELSPDQEIEDRDLRTAQEAKMSVQKEAEAVFFSVGAGGHTQLAQRESIFNRSVFLQGLYKRLVREDAADQFVGELLGLMLNDKAQVCGSTDFQEDNQTRVYTLLEIVELVELAQGNTQVWIVAAGYHKSKAALMALQNGLANSLAVDAEIADYLIKHGL